MKLIHLYIALTCAFFFSLSHFASAQDAEKEDASTEDSAGGDTAAGGTGDAAPAEGGGEGGAAPAAGGESAAAPAAGGESAPAAPAGGGEAAPAAPAPVAAAPAAAPAPAAPAPAPAPAFDMGAAVQSSAVAPPPAAGTAESNPIVKAVMVSGASGGSLSLSDAIKIGTSNIKKIANDSTGGTASLANLARNIDAKTKVIKAFGGIDDLSKLDDIIEQTETFDADQLESFKTLSLDETKSLKNKSSSDGGGSFDIADIGKIATKAKEAKVLKDRGIQLSADKLDDLNNKYDESFIEEAKVFTLDVLDLVFETEGEDAFSLENKDSFKTQAKNIEAVVAAGGSVDDIRKELGNVVLKDANGLPLVIESDGKYVWSKDILTGRVFHGLWSDIEDGDLGVFRINVGAKGKTTGLDIMGSDYGDNWEETFELTDDPSVLRSTSYADGEVEEVFFLKVLKDSNGDLILGSLQFETDEDLDDYEIARGDLPYSAIDTAKGKEKIALLYSSNTKAALVDNGFYDDTQLIGKESEAIAEYNKILTTKGSIVLKDTAGKAIVYSLGEGDETEYYWNSDLSGVKFKTVVGSRDEAPYIEEITFTATDWVSSDESGTYSGTYSSKGKIIVATEVEDGKTETSYHRIFYDGKGYRIVNLSRTDGKNPWDADFEAWDNFLWNEHYLTNYVDSQWGIDGSGFFEQGADVEYIAASESDATNLYNMLLDSWYAYDPNRKDTDGDGVPDYKDSEPNKGTVTDHDGDGIKNEADIHYPGNENKTDADKNGIVDAFDSDADGDGVIDALDAFPNDASETADSDKDGVGDNADFFPNDANKWNDNPSLKSNGTSAISGWSDLEKQSIQDYINGKYTDEASRNALEVSINFLEWAMTERTISNGDHLNQGVFIDKGAGFKNPDGIPYDLPQIQNIIGLLQQVHMIGDSNADNKDMIQGLLTALSDSTALANLVNEDHGDSVLTEDFAPVLDALLGTQRGRVDDEQSVRKNDLHEPLDLDNKEKNVRDGRTYKVGTVNQRALVGHINKISGVINDDDLNVQEVDLTVIASGRDTIILDDLTINAPDTAKEDAYVIAAADELYLRGEWSATNHKEMYAEPEPLDIEVKNSSLALVAVDEMNLVDVDITTGGSLAIASLDEINIWSTGKSGINEFTVGADADNDFEGLFLYAQKLIEVNGLNIQGRVDDIYMEAQTINLSNVTFPWNAAVLLRSENGVPTFDPNPTYNHKNVNLHNVIHPNVSGSGYLNSGHLPSNGKGGYQSDKASQSGRPYMKVESYK